VLQVQVPPEWAGILKHAFNSSDTNYDLRYFDTQVVRWPPPSHLGLQPYPFPKSRGPLSNALLKAMSDQAPELWPDWESSDELEEVRALPN
jgi:hypothetical protein